MDNRVGLIGAEGDSMANCDEDEDLVSLILFADQIVHVCADKFQVALCCLTSAMFVTDTA